jgi:hypothetical protein
MMNKYEFDKWPTDLFFILRELLTCLEYHRFMNTSQELFDSIRSKTIVFALGFRRTINFVLDDNWKGELVSKVDVPGCQIELSFFIRQWEVFSDFRGYLSSTSCSLISRILMTKCILVPSVFNALHLLPCHTFSTRIILTEIKWKVLFRSLFLVLMKSLRFLKFNSPRAVHLECCFRITWSHSVI